MKIIRIGVLSAALLAPFGTIVFAHGLSVPLEKEDGDYTVLLEHNALSGIIENEPVQLTLELSDKETKQSTEFKTVWVNIAPSVTGDRYASPVFGGSIAPSSFAPAGMTFTFPRAGTYTLSARFEKEDKALAETTFSITVRESPKRFTLTKDFFLDVTGGLVLGMFVSWVWTLLKRKNR